ncbi:MAG TPA: DUF4160 domain-containing protein [Acetobacteraceae bacterium]|jgi:hypothetical protein
MPELARFFGIIVMMFYDDHAPPHFHVRYGGQKAIVAIESLAILDGGLPPRALGLVMEWATLTVRNCARPGVLLNAIRH